MPNLSDERAALKAKAGAILDSAKAMERELTEEETAKVESIFEDIKSLDERIAKATKSDDLFKAFEGLSDDEKAPETKSSDKPAATLGEHFVKHAGDRLVQLKSNSNMSVSAPEFKAATDTQMTGGHDGAYEHWLTDVDTNFVRDVRRRLVVANLLGSGRISGQAIQYFLEGDFEGGAPNAFDYVEEGGAKPQFHFTDPTPVTEYLRKIAGFVKFTDEMLEDLAFVVSEINNRGLYELALMEENELLNGDGAGGSLVGIRNRTGIQTETSADVEDNADAIFRARTKVGLATPYNADALVINPSDYEALRLMRDANGQYYGGGFFQGQYASGSIQVDPPVWGLRTVQTPAVEPGTAIVGNFAQGGTVYRKGGVRVESTNSHANDFTNNMVTTRIEERVALAVRRPAAFVEVTLATSGS